jgi:LysM repeat protein
MSLERSIYGIEYTRRNSGENSSGIGCVVAAVALVALVSLAVSLIRSGDSAEPSAKTEPSPAAPVKSAAQESAAPAPPPEPKLKAGSNRPPRVRNLLMRLGEAEKRGDCEMAVSTIEQLRSLPGDAVADIDDALARRLGVHNIRRLFRDHNRQWVTEVTVKRGDIATFIAREHGSTLASLMKLNSLASADKVFVGQRLKVMNHPRFSLAVHRATKIADLSLNGKFFKRYYLTGPVSAKEGVYSTGAKMRRFFTAQGMVFGAADRAELETLLPPDTPVLVSEL